HSCRDPPDISSLPLHDALPISSCSTTSTRRLRQLARDGSPSKPARSITGTSRPRTLATPSTQLRTPGTLVKRRGCRISATSFIRSEEHTSELQSRENLV